MLKKIKQKQKGIVKGNIEWKLIKNNLCDYLINLIIYISEIYMFKLLNINIIKMHTIKLNEYIINNQSI